MGLWKYKMRKKYTVELNSIRILNCLISVPLIDSSLVIRRKAVATLPLRTCCTKEAARADRIGWIQERRTAGLERREMKRAGSKRLLQWGTSDIAEMKPAKMRMAAREVAMPGSLYLSSKHVAMLTESHLIELMMMAEIWALLPAERSLGNFMSTQL